MNLFSFVCLAEVPITFLATSIDLHCDLKSYLRFWTNQEVSFFDAQEQIKAHQSQSQRSDFLALTRTMMPILLLS